MNYKDFEYWKRRLKANTAPLPAGETKMLFHVFIDTIEELQSEVERLRSKRTPKPAQKLGSGSDSSSDT